MSSVQSHRNLTATAATQRQLPAEEACLSAPACHIFGVKRAKPNINSASNGVKAQVREMHLTVNRIVRSRKSALRFLAATGMYTPRGKIKPQFR